MQENQYILELLNGLGIAINTEQNSEIIINYPIKLDKKNMEYVIEDNYDIKIHTIGSLLADFLNIDFDDNNSFIDFFTKYSLSLIDYKSIRKIFNNNKCSEEKFKKFIYKHLEKYKNKYEKLQEQTDMILDYCLLNPNKKALAFKPIERLYVLRRFDSTLTLLNENKSAYYSVNLFSSYPGETEKEIYDFLSKKKNKIIDYDLIIPYDISAIIYKSLCIILKENVYLKICKNCNRYFIATNNKINYCDRLLENTKKTCKDIGRTQSFKNSQNNDEVLKLYYQVYNRKSMMKSRNPDIEQYVKDFNKYKDKGKIKVTKYKDGKISSEDFKNWIQKNI